MKRVKRTDLHRVGAIIPEDYDHVFSFNLSHSDSGWPVPSFGINCELDRRIWPSGRAGEGECINGEHDADGRCCVIGLRNHSARFAMHGAPGKCTVCGAAFVYGDVWVHKQSGEHIFIGHDCADKYRLLCDRTAWEREHDKLVRTAAILRVRAQHKEEREAFLAEHPGLADALSIDHPIISDIGARFREFRSLSEKQIALVLKLAAEKKNPPPEEAKVDAPEGRVMVRGVVVAKRVHESNFGDVLKMTVKVTTPKGIWLAWGTVPNSIAWIQPDKGECYRVEPGDEVEFSATLTRGREPHFALFKRPTKARIVTRKALQAQAGAA